MPTYAILGATGATGAAILRSLLQQPPKDLKLNIFVRSKSKLINKFPDLSNTKAFQVDIIEGTPDDNNAMLKALKNVDVIMACIATNESTAGISIALNTATAMVNALKTHQSEERPAYRTPTILQLRSASCNKVLVAHEPFIGRYVAGFCFAYVYADLMRACERYESSAAASPGLLDYIYIDPPSIHDSEGTTPTGYKLVLDEFQEAALSYADLGVAFCEVAERRKEFASKGVGVSATGKVNLTWPVLMGYMFQGAKGRIWG